MDDHQDERTERLQRGVYGQPSNVFINHRVEQVERLLERERVEDQRRIEAEEAEWRARRAGSTEQRS